jgi:hypothetical protein
MPNNKILSTLFPGVNGFSFVLSGRLLTLSIAIYGVVLYHFLFSVYSAIIGISFFSLL